MTTVYNKLLFDYGYNGQKTLIDFGGYMALELGVCLQEIVDGQQTRFCDIDTGLTVTPNEEHGCTVVEKNVTPVWSFPVRLPEESENT